MPRVGVAGGSAERSGPQAPKPQIVPFGPQCYYAQLVQGKRDLGCVEMQLELWLLCDWAPKLPVRPHRYTQLDQQRDLPYISIWPCVFLSCGSIPNVIRPPPLQPGCIR